MSNDLSKIIVGIIRFRGREESKGFASISPWVKPKNVVAISTRDNKVSDDIMRGFLVICYFWFL
jgi:hypothetical protein